MIDLEPIRERWIADRPVYAALGEHMRGLLNAELQRRGLLCSVDARAKEVASLLKKVLRKSYRTPYEDIHDKAGIRVVVSFAADVATVEDVIRQRFRVERYENKTLGLDYHELGYLGVHFDVSLLDGDLGVEQWRSLIAEIQVHTRAQNCWADVSHHLLYKPAQEAPIEVKRRIYRLMALVELFDESVQEARKAIQMVPGASESQVLSDLEQHFYQFAARPYDRELSFDIIGSLERLYAAGERQSFGELMRQFVENNHAKLVELFAAYRDDDRCNPLLFQPEALMIFERLEHDPFQLREAWTASFPFNLLESLAAIWGRAV